MTQEQDWHYIGRHPMYTIHRVVAVDHWGFYMSKFVSILVSKNRININLNALVNISPNIFALPFQEKIHFLSSTRDTGHMITVT